MIQQPQTLHMYVPEWWKRTGRALTAEPLEIDRIDKSVCNTAGFKTK